MSILDGDFYENIDNPAKRIAIIITDYSEKDLTWQRMEKDVENIKRLLHNLGFEDKNIKEIRDKAKNVIAKQTSDFCTFDEENDGYIMMFNVTYKKGTNTFRTGRTFYNSQDMQSIFVVNNLIEWAHKPKLIFNQNPSIISKELNQSCGSNILTDHYSYNTIELPIDVDIFESFSNDGEEDSDGDDNGSFYIQALCDIINQHIKDGTIKVTCINNIMYEVHAKVEEMRGKERGQARSQTPFIKTTLIKDFIFPA